ncbi:MAG TPA: hydrogenase nickel incorporation protein HypB [Phycisphaerae bacterium]|nr:hydrogenase nickel incorporation protein HypB [Phycisphaerae bacterium]
MCKECGCGDTEIVTVDVQQKLLSANDLAAAHNRDHFTHAGIFAINLMGSPGSGKTALLEATARKMGGTRLAAITGDLETDRDAERLRKAGIPCAAITTGSACHLDARMVHKALHELPTGAQDFLFIENVGNLVCPAIYDLGQALNVVALSITEGEDKPLKYPVMFHRADLVVITKIDLEPALPGFNRKALEDALRRVMPRPNFLCLSAMTGEGVDAWINWLQSNRKVPAHRAHVHDLIAGSP